MAPVRSTLDLLAACFDSSARLNPTIDVVPLFPYLVKDLAGMMLVIVYKLILIFYQNELFLIVFFLSLKFMLHFVFFLSVQIR